MLGVPKPRIEELGLSNGKQAEATHLRQSCHPSSTISQLSKPRMRTSLNRNTSDFMMELMKYDGKINRNKLLRQTYKLV